MKLPTTKLKQVGFTLVELLVVIAIIAILISIGLASFSRVQRSSRDSQRRADLRDIAGALENFYSDYNNYPEANSGQIMVYDTGCISTGAANTLGWGTGDFSCASKTYMRQLPADPLSPTQSYRYEVCDANQQVYAIFTDLEINPNPALPTPPGSCSFVGTEDYYVTSQE